MPADAVDGVRRDVFDRVDALKPAFIRWPGGQRRPGLSLAVGCWSARQPHGLEEPVVEERAGAQRLGTDEYLRFCRNVGAEPTIVVNVEGRGATVEEAAAWVEYCNGPASSKYGACARPTDTLSRTRSTLGAGQRDLGRLGPRPLRCRDLCAQLPPLPGGHAGGRPDASNSSPAATTTWRGTAPCFARRARASTYLSIHHYYGNREMGGRPLNLMAHPLVLRALLSRGRPRMIRELVPRRPIKLAINEWGLALPVEQAYSIDAALTRDG